MKVTVTIIAKNEADRIVKAVTSCQFAEEVVVVDSGSTDGTVELARSAGARVVHHPWLGYGAQKNFAASLASTDWVLNVDADEVVTDDLADEILALPEHPGHVAFLLVRENFVGDRKVPHWPWWRERVLRLYDRKVCRFSEPPIHESLVVGGGSVGKLSGVLMHYSWRSLEELKLGQEKYAELGARGLMERGRVPGRLDPYLRSVASFLRHWLIRGYLVGGVWGFRLSFYGARATWLKYRKAYERGSGSRGQSGP